MEYIRTYEGKRAIARGYTKESSGHWFLGKFQSKVVCKKKRLTQKISLMFRIPFPQATIRTIFWQTQQVGHPSINIFFLLCNSHEDVYRELPYGMLYPGNEVSILLKSIYGLKQASQQWFAKLIELLPSQGFSTLEMTNTPINNIAIYIVYIYVTQTLHFISNTCGWSSTLRHGYRH